MTRVKTFIFSTRKFGEFDGQWDVNWNPDVIDFAVNEFLQGKELISMNTTSITRGNNPPCYALVYTITYKD